MAAAQAVPPEAKPDEHETSEEEENSDADADESRESDDEELFEVEKIIARRKDEEGQFKYRVRWKGYPPSNDTWEPVTNLGIVADMVQEFDARQDEKARARQEERRLRKLRMEGKKLPGEESSDDASDSSKEESQLCETTKFFKRLEKDTALVFTQPDLYSKVKSRSAILASKKQEEKVVDSSSAPSTSKGQSDSSRGRGRGRPRGGGIPRDKGSGRGRGRPPKGTAGKSSDEEDGGQNSISPYKGSGRGRGRPRTKSVKKSSNTVDTGDSLSDSDSSGGEVDKQSNKQDSDQKDDSDDSALPATPQVSKKTDRDTSEDRKDSPVSVAAAKTPGKPRGRPPKKSDKETEGKGEGEDSARKVKGSGRGRGRPRKIKESTEDSDDELGRPKIKAKGRGRPKKNLEDSSEDRDRLDSSASSVKTKGRGRGRPPKKPIRDRSDDNEDSEDSTAQASSSKGKSKKLVDNNSEDHEASDVVTPAKKTKTGRPRGRPRKIVSSNNSDDGSDSSVAVGKNSGKVRSRSGMKCISELSDNDQSDDSLGKRNIKNGAISHKISGSEKSDDDSDSLPCAVDKNKGKGKPRKKFTIEDSEESGSDHTSNAKETPQTAENKTVKKTTKTKKTPKEKKQQGPSCKTESEKNLSKSERNQTAAKPEMDKTSGAESSVNKSTLSEPGVKESQTALSEPEATAKRPELTTSSKHGQAVSTKVLPTKPKPEGVIPVLEKLAMTSVTENFLMDKKDNSSKVSGDIKPSVAPSGTKGEKLEHKISQKKGLKSIKDSKEAVIFQDKKLVKGIKKGLTLKRKQDTASEHAKAVKEGEASPVKTVTPMPSTSLPNDQSVVKTSPLPPPQTPVDSTINTPLPAPPHSLVDASSNQSVHSGILASVRQEVADSVVEDTKPVPSSVSSKLLTESKTTSSKPRVKSDSTKEHKKSSKSKKDSSVKTQKEKIKKKEKSGEKNVKTATPSFARSPGDGLPSSGSDISSGVSASDAAKSSGIRKESSAKLATIGSDTQSTAKADLSAGKLHQLDVPESKPTKPDSIISSLAKPATLDKVSVSDSVDSKIARMEGDDVKRKVTPSVPSDVVSFLGSIAVKPPISRTGSTSDLPSSFTTGPAKQAMFRTSSTSELSSSLTSISSRLSQFTTSSSSPGRSTPVSSGRDSLLPTPSRDTSGVFSSPSTSRDMPSMYPYNRDLSASMKNTGRGSASPRDQTQASMSPRDSQLGAGTSRDYMTPGSSRDFQPAAGYNRDVLVSDLPFSSGSSSPFSSPTGKMSPYSRDIWGMSSRQDFNANIAGKESGDKLYSSKSLYSSSRSSTLSLSDTDRSKQVRGIDPDLGRALHDIDLEYVEKLELTPATPMELSHEELRQAVLDGNCYLVERALKCVRSYDLDLPDNKGYTLLMNAVHKGFDDIIVHLLTHGANAQVQVKGHTALMVAVEQAESSTVYMLLEMGARVNMADNDGETALFKAVRRGDKQILKLILEHGADFNMKSHAGLTPLDVAKQIRLADIDVTLIEHIERVVTAFEEVVQHALSGTARLLSTLFPHHCVPLCDSDSLTIAFKYQPTLPQTQDKGCLLFIAHALFDPIKGFKCRLYGQCAVQKVTLNRVPQPSISDDSNFVMVCQPLITGWNELNITITKDPTAKAKLIVCAYRAQLS